MALCFESCFWSNVLDSPLHHQMRGYLFEEWPFRSSTHLKNMTSSTETAVLISELSVLVG